ncbi:beta-glucosidase 11 isoform X4 [Nicotiana tabacum]|uniref:beta-glucosidase 11 isoform X4 n=1 Tax=Nicotiana tabacum TaxID=4097 RepID=UPI003F4E9883
MWVRGVNNSHPLRMMLRNLQSNYVSIQCLLVTVFGTDHYCRADFPPGFVFGAGTSAYQVEGAAFEDGRTPSIWDTFAHAGFSGGANGDIACDLYHKYKEDVQLMVDTGLEAYRFSISWSRLIPGGRGPVNPKGLQFYNNYIDELISHGHTKFLGNFSTFCQLHIIEKKEKQKTALRDSSEERIKSLSYLLILQSTQHGFVGFSIYGFWCVPYTNSGDDVNAAQRANEFYTGWIMNPLIFGDYPSVMKKAAGTRIPTFSKYEAKLVKGSVDFIGLNHYRTASVKDRSSSIEKNTRDFGADIEADISLEALAADQYPVIPSGLYEFLEYLKEAFGNPPIYIQENGASSPITSSPLILCFCTQFVGSYTCVLSIVFP